MNIIEQTLGSPLEAIDILNALIALVIWFIVWHLIIVRFFNKFAFISGLMSEGPILAPLISYMILLCLYVVAILFIASIQLVMSEGAKALFACLLFWGPVTAFFILLIRHIRK